MSKSANNHAPFFDLLKNNKTFKWIDECEEAFKKWKEYLVTWPILTQPKPREVLYIYLVALERAISSMLVKEKRSKQKLIYFSS